MNKEVMKMAWRIKKENKKYIFGECLRMAWNIVKSVKNMQKLIKKNENTFNTKKYTKKDKIKNIVLNLIATI